MMLIVADNCILCGRCAKVCPTSIISMSDQGPQIGVEKERGCIRCGHCVAVCPVEALDHTLVPLKNQVPLAKNPPIEPADSLQMLRAVRSIRNYKSTSVSEELVCSMLDAARYVPTGRNTQGVQYVAVMDTEKVQLLIERVITFFEEAGTSENPSVRFYQGIAKIYRQTGYDIVFRGAPHVVLAMAPLASHFGLDNARLSMVYARVQATALNLGTCWAGFFEMYAEARPEELCEILGLDTDLRLGAAIMLGYPAFAYNRLVERDPLKVEFR